ncbi:AAA family ATPase [Streptomyces sp. NPDC048172]|uniref:AAA family ATPase n=1 Tax=Streptomyces sp. NPDC048172 TaxID=3365505 RepID=UPI00371B192F
MSASDGASATPACLILTGMPGAGKSTVAPLVAARHARAARVNGDVLSYMVESGRVGFNGTPSEESRRQVLLCARNMCSLAANFADAGITPVLEHVVADREVLDLMTGLLRPRPVRFVVLAPSPEVCERRNAARAPEERIGYPIAPLYRAMEEKLGDVGWWLDSSDLTPEETAATIVAHAAGKATL